ncbi:MAG: nuclear transport factor 2 family protein [Myxococcaceae bacterium]|nr:nuclear transport factor 2 family protein [Myxococcaceae bacterium]
MIRSVVLSVLLGICACSHGPASGQASSSASTAEDIRSLLELEQALFRAIQARDRAALTELLAEDFVFRGPGDVEVDRAGFLDSIASIPGTLLSVEGAYVRAHVFGDMGVLTGQQHARVRLPDGTEVVDTGTFSDICVRREGRWKVVLAHSIPAAPEAPAAQPAQR